MSVEQKLKAEMNEMGQETVTYHSADTQLSELELLHPSKGLKVTLHVPIDSVLKHHLYATQPQQKSQ